jgi:uncharacterized protein
MKRITTAEELHALYGAPREAAIQKVTDRIIDAYRVLIDHSPFMALATVGPEGLDCSPRGDRGTVVHVEDERTIMLPDRQGNNRVDSLLNIVRDPRVALMFLIPGSATVLRVNGEAIVTQDADLLGRFAVEGKTPRTVVVVSVGEVYFQCARAVMRAGLWEPEGFIDAARLPSAGSMLKAAGALALDVDAYDREWPERARETMW